ncbi:MAG TPA: flagellar basal body L-ring protein FlgH [Bryobacteraceae bacterium]|nr:flagellar basal body L-ring protein FlgH [Bryobacteraceae bacterium]HOL69961.1 flagellar basal body L-ring protein FlgH [Bryobacteraceae bacterium]HOQ44202.1 flagellar basal body L-ring protein FlgH [Bryobacteraceae bacterium]HPU70520.1 flagellar basal body L-ring protein FlgH [Bryobacteraceae bacterium]
MRNSFFWAALLAIAAQAADKDKTLSPLDQYVQQAVANAERAAGRESAPGSIWQPGALLGNLASDPKASQVDDLVTIIVTERASAIAKGTTKSARASKANYSVGAAFGRTNPSGPLANMLSAAGEQSLAGEGATTRETVLTTTISARVAAVLPNGYLVLEGSKNVAVNSENQIVTVRGVARPLDIAPDNTIFSDRLAQLEVLINGKGVVNDAIRRPFFLYRLLLGLLPF